MKELISALKKAEEEARKKQSEDSKQKFGIFKDMIIKDDANPIFESGSGLKIYEELMNDPEIKTIAEKRDKFLKEMIYVKEEKTEGTLIEPTANVEIFRAQIIDKCGIDPAEYCRHQLPMGERLDLFYCDSCKQCPGCCACRGNK